MTLPLHGFQDWQNPLHTADLQTDVQNILVGSGGAATSAIYDMRAYQEFSLMISALPNALPATGFGHVQVQITWWANDIATQIMHQRRFAFYPQTATAAFASALGRVMCKGTVRGPYMTVTVWNGGPDQLQVNYRVLGNTRYSGGEYLINTDINGQNNLMSDMGFVTATATAVGAGASTSTIWPIMQGMGVFTLSVPVPPFLYEWLSPDNLVINAFNMTVAGNQVLQMGMPWTAVRLRITNQTGGVNSGSIQGTSVSKQWA